MAGRNEIQQTIERILNLTADHINVSDGKLCFNIIGIVGSGGTHLTHVRIGGTGQQQRLRTLAGGTRIVRISFKHLLVRGCGASVIALLCQHIRLLMLRWHLLLGAGSGSRVCRIGIRIAGIRRGTGHTGLLRGCDQLVLWCAQRLFDEKGTGVGYLSTKRLTDAGVPVHSVKEEEKKAEEKKKEVKEEKKKPEEKKKEVKEEKKKPKKNWNRSCRETVQILPSWRAISNRRSSVGTHSSNRIGNVADVCTMAWNVFSVVSIT